MKKLVLTFLLSTCIITPILSSDVHHIDDLQTIKTHRQHRPHTDQTYSCHEKGNDEKEQESYIERFHWDAQHTHLLAARTLETQEGIILLRQTFQYDDAARLIEETAWKWEDGPYYTKHIYFYDQSSTRLKRTSIENDHALFLNSQYGLLSWLKSQFFPEAEYVEENGDPFAEYRSKSYLCKLLNYYDSLTEINTYSEKEVSDLVRITFINGILNTKQDFLESVQKLSEQHGGNSIHYIFRPTDGFAWDILRSSLTKIGFVSPQAEALAKIWKKLIAEMGGCEGQGRIIHYAHSIGGTNTSAAKMLLTPEEQSKIEIITLGSPTIIPNQGFHSVINYISVRDGVALLDPISRIQTLFQEYSHIIYIGTYAGIPLIDHFLYGETYSEVVEAYGKEFIKKYINSD